MSALPTAHHMPQLDALRGIAALIVVVSHSAREGLMPSLLGGGFGQMGVGLFYVLSAFLLTSLYTEKAPNSWALKDYLVRRGARVLPLFYAALFASFIVEVLSGVSVYRAFETPSAALANVFLIQGTSVLWSIPVEIQFYLIFAVFWFLLNISARSAFAFLIIFQFFIGALAIAAGVDRFNLPYWMHFFTFGCVLGFAARHPGIRKKITENYALRVFSAVVILGTPLLLPAVRSEVFGMVRFPIPIDPVALLWVAIVTVAFVFGLVPSRWLENRLFRMLGELSFGVYLIHMAIIIGVKRLLGDTPLFEVYAFILVIVITYGLAAIVNTYLERPAQKRILKMLLPSRGSHVAHEPLQNKTSGI